MIFKGDRPFTYGHYGVHLGQEDRLIFLGPENNRITGYFIDCRRDSPTSRNRVVTQFSPSASRALCIPPGVAHTFDTSGIFTLNAYGVWLPDPKLLFDGGTEWTIEGDIVNVPMDVTDAELPLFQANRHRASEVFYDLVRRLQSDTLADLQHQYPQTEDITFETGETKRIKFWKRLKTSQRVATWEPIESIEGAGWSSNLVVWTGADVGYVPILFKRPVSVEKCTLNVGSGEAFIVHRHRDEHLTFLGSSFDELKIDLIDCRKGSATLAGRANVTFRPSALRQLVVPRGVAYRLRGSEGAFVVNCPELFLNSAGLLDDASITWPSGSGASVELQVSALPAPDQFYVDLINGHQFKADRSPVTDSDPFDTDLMGSVPVLA